MATIVYDDYLTSANKYLDPQKQQALKDLNALYQNQANTVTSQYDTEIGNANTAYEDQYRENAVQKLINERQVAENMANLGLTDSGLNRTQQTAVQLSYANQKGAIDRAKQAQIDALTQQKAQNLATIEQNRLAGQNEINQYYSDLAARNATSAYNTALEQDRQYREAQLQAQLEAQKYKLNNESDTKTSDYEYLISALSDNSIFDIDQKSKAIYDYAYKYNIENPELYSLLNAAGLSIEDYNRYWQSGSSYVLPEDYTGTGTVKEWNYKTDGSLNYKFKVVDNTTNWFWGIDGNDKVTIYYPDGTLLAENVRVDQLPKSIQKSITDKIGKNKKDYTFTYKANLKDSKF